MKEGDTGRRRRGGKERDTRRESPTPLQPLCPPGEPMALEAISRD